MKKISLSDNLCIQENVNSNYSDFLISVIHWLHGVPELQSQLKNKYAEFIKDTDPQGIASYATDAELAFDRNYGEWLLSNTMLGYDGGNDMLTRVYLKSHPTTHYSQKNYLNYLEKTHLSLYQVLKATTSKIIVTDKFGNFDEEFSLYYPEGLPKLKKGEIVGLRMLKDNTVGVGIYRYIPEFQNKVYAAIMSEMMQRMRDSNGQKLTKELFPLIIEKLIISSWITLTSELEKHFKKVQSKHTHKA